MKSLQTSKNGVERSFDELLGQRQAILAQLGETYLALEAYRTHAEQCVAHIQNLRAALVDLDRGLQGRAQAHEQARAFEREEVGNV